MVEPRLARNSRFLTFERASESSERTISSRTTPGSGIPDFDGVLLGQREGCCEGAEGHAEDSRELEETEIAVRATARVHAFMIKLLVVSASARGHSRST